MMDVSKIGLYVTHIMAQKWMQISLGLVLSIVLTLWHSVFLRPAYAQLDSSSSFRLSRIETELRTLQAEIRQVETALGRVERRSGETVIIQDMASPSQPTSASANDANDIEATQSNLMFDQLATLVIETRQDMFALQDKVEAIEQAIE